MSGTRKSTLWVLALTKYGDFFKAAAAVGVHLNTMYRAARGYTVSEATRKKLEDAFGHPIEVLQRPIEDAAAEATP